MVLATALLVLLALTGMILSRNVFEPLAAHAPNTVVAATLGVSLVLMELGRLAAETRDLWLPPLLSTPVVFASDAVFRVTLTELQLINCGAAAAVDRGPPRNYASGCGRRRGGPRGGRGIY